MTCFSSMIPEACSAPSRKVDEEISIRLEEVSLRPDSGIYISIFATSDGSSTYTIKENKFPQVDVRNKKIDIDKFHKEYRKYLKKRRFDYTKILA